MQQQAASQPSIFLSWWQVNYGNLVTGNRCRIINVYIGFGIHFTTYGTESLLSLVLVWAGIIVFSLGFLIKGQLVSKYPFGDFKSTKKQRNFCMDFCPSLLKEVKSKNKGTWWFYFYSLTLLFWFYLFLLGQKSLQKFCWFFGRFGDTKKTFRN